MEYGVASRRGIVKGSAETSKISSFKVISLGAVLIQRDPIPGAVGAQTETAD